MTDKQAAYIKLQTQIDLYSFSLAQTRDPINQIKLKNHISNLLRAQDAL